MSDPFFGELYLRTTRPFLSETLTEAEGRFLRTNLPQGRLLDLGCGHGRHLAHVPGFGVDRDPISLDEAKAVGGVCRADFRALPFRDRAFQGAWCWYNSIGTFEDDQLPLILREVARCLEPGGVFIVQGTNITRAESQPEAGFDGPLPDGSHLLERAVFNAERRRDEINRHLTLPDGRVMEADFFIRYYDLPEWQVLLAEAGFEAKWWVGGLDGAALEASSTDVIVGATRRA
ncbi:MAG TPA: class I SAM-dependent methyltransferase [Archangium sp.]